MTIFITGATGATGRLLVEQLLQQGHTVKAMVRSRQKLAALEEQYSTLHQIEGTVLGMTLDELDESIHDCDAIACCLGHNVTFKGMYGKPRRLVRDTVAKLCKAWLARKREKPVRFVLMNTTGNQHTEIYPIKERIILGILYAILPPHTDNIQAARFLNSTIGPDHPAIHWVAVRPDTLVDEPEVTNYDLQPFTDGGAIFVDHKTSRINVANAMMRLMLENNLIEQWRGKFPVVYNVV